MQQGQVHPAPVRGELQGVFQQVQQHLAHAALVGEHIGQVGGDVGDQLQVAADPEFFQLQDRLGGHLAQRQALGVEQGLPAGCTHLQQVLGEFLDVVEAAGEHVAEAGLVDLAEGVALEGELGGGQRRAQLMGHHPQQALLHPKALDQGFVFLAQHQQLIFQLQLALGAAAIDLSGPQAHAQARNHLHLLPARQPAAQLLGDGIAGNHLLGQGGQFHQGRGGHQPMQLQQLGLAGRIGDLQAHLEGALLTFEELDQVAQVLAGQVVAGSYQQQLQFGAFGRSVAGDLVGRDGVIGAHVANPMGIWAQQLDFAMTKATNAVRPRAGMS